MNLFYAVSEYQESSRGGYDTITVYDEFKVALKVYYGGYHEEHAYHWRKLFAADLANGVFLSS